MCGWCAGVVVLAALDCASLLDCPARRVLCFSSSDASISSQDSQVGRTHRMDRQVVTDRSQRMICFFNLEAFVVCSILKPSAGRCQWLPIVLRLVPAFRHVHSFPKNACAGIPRKIKNKTRDSKNVWDTSRGSDDESENLK